MNDRGDKEGPKEEYIREGSNTNSRVSIMKKKYTQKKPIQIDVTMSNLLRKLPQTDNAPHDFVLFSLRMIRCERS